MKGLCEIEFDKGDQILIIKQLGIVSIENCLKILPDALAAKDKYNARKILFDQRDTKSAVKPTEWIDFFEYMKKIGVGKKSAIAGVVDDLNSIQAEAGVIAHRRGFNAHFFDDIEEAKRWLRTQ